MRRTRVRALLAAGVLSLAAGCALPTAGGYIPEGKASGDVAKVESLDGLTIGVGSKNFSESVILGKMAIILLRAAGADAIDLTNIPGSAASREAQLQGDIGASWDYTGTGWITYLGHEKPIPDEKKQYVAVRDEDLEKYKLVWLPPGPLNNTYGFVTTQKTFKKYKITKLSQLKKVPVKDRTLCVEPEFLNRGDGLPGMLKSYGVPLGDPKGVPRKNLKVFQTGVIYDATTKGDCLFGEVFTTDGRILANNLRLLQDDKEFFPKYNISMVLREDIVKKYPQLRKLFAPLSKKLTNKTMLKLNAKVDVEGQEPAQVAYDWLKQEGFVTDP